MEQQTPSQSPQLGSFLTGAPAPTQDEKTQAMLAHIGGIFIPILVPLFIMLAKGKESAWVRTHATEALNFQLMIMVGYLVGTALSAICIGIPLLAALVCAALVLGIIAGVKASNGEIYRYPATPRLVK